MAQLIADVTPRNEWTAAPGQATFTVTFPFFENANLVVTVDGVPVTPSVVSGAGTDNGGFVTLSPALAGGETVIILRDLAIERLTDFPDAGRFDMPTLNLELDRMVAVQQELKLLIDNAVTINPLQPNAPLDADGKRLIGLADPVELQDAATRAYVISQLAGIVLGVVSDGSITSAKLASMTQATLKGRAAGAGTGTPQDLTAAQVKTLLAIAQSDVSGLVTALGNKIETSTRGQANGVASLDASSLVPVAQLGALPLTKYIQSAGYPFVGGGSISFAHGFGVVPRLIETFVECTVAENGYIVGDQLRVPPFYYDDTIARGVSLTANTTNVIGRFATNTFWIPSKTNGTPVAMSAGSWAYVFRVFA